MLAIPYIEMDRLYWRPNWRGTADDAFENWSMHWRFSKLGARWPSNRAPLNGAMSWIWSSGWTMDLILRCVVSGRASGTKHQRTLAGNE